MSAGDRERTQWRRANPDPPWECWICKQMITVGTGQRSESLAVHHVNGLRDPDTLVPVHIGCHTIHHHAGSGRPDHVGIAVAMSNRQRKGEKRPPKPSHVGLAVAASNRRRRGERRPAQSEAMKRYWKEKTGGSK